MFHHILKEKSIVRHIIPAMATLIFWRVIAAFVDILAPIAAIVDESLPLYMALLFTMILLQYISLTVFINVASIVIRIVPGKNTLNSEFALFKERIDSGLHGAVKFALNFFTGQFYILCFLIYVAIQPNGGSWYSRIPVWLMAFSIIATASSISVTVYLFLSEIGRLKTRYCELLTNLQQSP